MKGGHLNLHSGPGGSLTAVCADLETIWAYAIQTHLTIPLRDLGVGITAALLFHPSYYQSINFILLF